MPEPYFCDRLDPDVREALDRARDALARAGHDVRDVADRACGAHRRRLPAHRPAGSVVVSRADARASHADRYSPGVRLRLEMGRYVLAEDYVRAMRLRARLTPRGRPRAGRLRRAAAADACRFAAPLIGAATVDVGRRRRSRCARVMLRLTQLFNITGHPGDRAAGGR